MASAPGTTVGIELIFDGPSVAHSFSAPSGCPPATGAGTTVGVELIFDGPSVAHKATGPGTMEGFVDWLDFSVSGSGAAFYGGGG